jgi:rubrerythrin
MHAKTSCFLFRQLRTFYQKNQFAVKRILRVVDARHNGTILEETLSVTQLARFASAVVLPVKQGEKTLAPTGVDAASEVIAANMTNRWNRPYRQTRIKEAQEMDEKLLTLIDTAIQREEDAYAFYNDLHGRASDAAVKDTLEYIAGEEKKHRAFLVKYREGGFDTSSLRLSDVTYYQIAEYQKEPAIDEKMSSADVYLVASHRESRSHKFYTELANLQTDAAAKSMLLKMANEELKHKEKMEYLYSNTAFGQTSGG